MPFDKDSFLKGVITGMRLPRVPGGKPPFQPVPSGKFILAEDGTNIITEKEWPDATIYDGGVWYPSPWGVTRYRFKKSATATEYVDNVQYFFATVTSPSQVSGDKIFVLTFDSVPVTYDHDYSLANGYVYWTAGEDEKSLRLGASSYSTGLPNLSLYCAIAYRDFNFENKPDGRLFTGTMDDILAFCRRILRNQFGYRVFVTE